MSDLAERLRAMGAAQRPHIGDEAADEIERLREERDFWKESRDFRVKEHLADKAEIERLRAALKRIVNENADIYCEDIARAALEDDDE